MSYCRLSDESDVYLYQDVRGGWTCCFCRLAEHGERNCDSREDAIAHLQHHQRAGHKVPAHAIEQLEDEIAGRARRIEEEPWA